MGFTTRFPGRAGESRQAGPRKDSIRRGDQSTAEMAHRPKARAMAMSMAMARPRA